MKIVVITMGISRMLKPLLESNFEVIGLVECPARKSPSRMSFCIMQWLSALRGTSLKLFAKKNRISYFKMDNSDYSLECWLKELSPDLIVVQSMSRLLKNEIINIPILGVINVHRSILPDYRGPNPLFWQYYDYVDYTGVTIHFIDKGEDTGDIILQKKIPFLKGVKSNKINDILLSDIAPKLLIEAISKIKSGTVERISQKRLKSPTKRARNLLESEHRTVINWCEWPVERVWHVLRGTEGWLNAIEQPKGLYEGQRWIFLDYKKNDEIEIDCKVAGVYKIRSNIYYVQCRDGIIFMKINFNVKNMLKTIYNKMAS